jgi:hypothetical protein
VHIVTTHKGADFDALASIVAANLLYPGIVTVLPGSLNPNVRAFMSKKIITIQPGDSPGHAAHLMIKHDIGRLPVVEEGKIVGIFSRSDAVADLYGLCLLGDNLATGCKQNRFCFNSPAEPGPVKTADDASKK